MMQGEGAGGARHLRSALMAHIVEPGVDAAAERAVAVMVEHGAPVRARHGHHRAVVFAHIVQIDAERQARVVGMGVEGPVLVPFHRRAETRGLHVELAVVDADVGAEQRLDGIQHGGRAHQPVEERPVLERRLQPPDTRRVGPVAVLQVVAGVGRLQAPRLRDRHVGLPAQLFEQIRRQRPRKDEIAGFLETPDLFLRERHGAPPLPSRHAPPVLPGAAQP